MKITLILLFALLFTPHVQCQEKVVLYYNANWQLTQKEKAVYFREAEFDLEHLRLNGPVADFSVAGKKLMEGNYTNGKREGVFTFFFANGNVERKGLYESNHRIGKWEYYYQNGKLKQLILFYPTEGIDNFVVVDYFDRDGKQWVKDGTGKWINDSIKGSLFNPLSLFKVTGQYKDSLKVGNWKLIRLSDKKMMHSEQFSKGYFTNATIFSPFVNDYGSISTEMMNKLPDNQLDKFKNTESFVLDSTAFQASLLRADVETIFKTLTGKKYTLKNRRVMYPEGDYALMEFIAKNIQYPFSAIERRKSGRVFIDTFIDFNGNLTEAKVLYGVDQDLDNEALRIIKLIKKWLPALKDGVAVKSRLTIPVTFEIKE